MKYDCEMIRDLLPLYEDGICSGSSRQAVEAHLSECAACRSYLDTERSGGELEGMMNLDRNAVLSSQARFFKRKSAVAGTVIAGIFMLPVLICLIVNLAQGGLTWFLVVLAAMLIPFSLVAVPLLAPENKALWTLGAFTVSLLMLLAVCNIRSGGRWFFIAATAVLFGLSVIFAPFAVRAKPVAERLGSNKALTVMALDTGLFLAMMLCIGFANRLGAGYFRLAAMISLPILGWIWAMFLIIRYLPFRRPFKVGACILSAGILMLVLGLLFSMQSPLILIETGSREFTLSINQGVTVCCFIAGLILAGSALFGKNNRRK